MTVEQQTRPPETRSPSPPVRTGRWSGFRHLLMARMKELRREPEVIFWVFVFPLLLAFGLGIAFRQTPPTATPVAIVSGPNAGRTLQLIERSPLKSSVHAQIVESADAL